ncbi:hypothetical protein CVIRNUC_003513 [Coccomyxa viridis]|uniref:Uncharacterized protein n=1 Tax=Coccomyxa viridis TaxID=1274662 RepID=A0AAV1HZN9_9CHLO|nr:hypothetical protein CVIRNUC_003513 [Coccomyxa viridis]
MYTFAFANTAFYVMALWNAFAQSQLASILLHYPRLCLDVVVGNPREGGVVTALYIVDDFGCTPIQDLDEIQDEDVDKSLVVFYTWQHVDGLKEYAIMHSIPEESDTHELIPDCEGPPTVEPVDQVLSVSYDSRDVTQAYNRYAGPLKDFYRGAAVCQCELLESRMIDRCGVFLFDGSERDATIIDLETLPDKRVIKIFPDSE